MTAEDQAPAEKKAARPRPDIWPRLHHRQLTVRINGQPAITGELVTFTIYEIVIKTDRGREVLIPKHAIVAVDLPEDWRRTPAPGGDEVTP